MSVPVGQALRFPEPRETPDAWGKFLAGWQHNFGECGHDLDTPN